MTPADLIAYIGSLQLAGGDLDGEMMTPWPWERRFCRGAFRNPGDAALSMARGNGKSALCSAIASAVVDPIGPLTGNRREVVVVASSFDQSRIVYEDVLSFMRARYDLEDRKHWRKQDSANRATLEYRATGARVRCIGSNPARAHGLRPFLVLADEPAQWDASKADRMVSALRTGLGKVPGSKLVALGTRPATDEHWFSRALLEAPYSQVYQAPRHLNPFLVSTWRRANPSMDYLPSLRARLEEERRDARRDPDALASFKALRLNQGTSDVSVAVLLDLDSWKRAQDLPDVEERGGYVLGLDLGTSNAMSAAAGYWKTGQLRALACFPEIPSLAARGLADGVGRLYEKMAERGELIRAGSRVSDIGRLLSEVLSRWGQPSAIVCDRWRDEELRQVAEDIRFPRVPIVIRGMGFKDGAEDVRGFRKAMLSDLVKPDDSLLLTAAVSEARLVSDPAGNWKLSKQTQGGRRFRAKDDAAAAAVLAVAAGFRTWHQGTRRSHGAYLGMV